MAFIDEARLLFPWMPEGMLKTYARGYAEYGDEDLAWAEVRADDRYDKAWVPGNTRDDGSLRMTEAEYFSTLDAYWNTVLSVGINPQLYKSNGKFLDLIRGEVSALEFSQRVDVFYDRVLEAAPEVRQYYSDAFGIDMPAHALLASIMDPAIGEGILNKQITMAEIGAEGMQHGFGMITQRFARDIYKEGVDAQGAEDLFGAAQEQLPILGVLARRHADPDDTFDLEEFTAQAIFDDPIQRRRIRRLVAQEQSLFSNPGQQQYQRLQAGSDQLVSGLGDL